MIVDDSGFMRMAIRKMLEKHANISIVAEATSADEAVRLARQHRPHIITMDIEMPGGSGIDATKIIMKESPTAIIMVSSITTFGADATIHALNYGAVDFIPKASSFVSLDIAKIEKDLLRKILYWAEHWKTFHKNGIPEDAVSLPPRAYANKDLKPRLIVIGASTGGPKIIPEIFKLVRKIDTPIVIALHMPPMYTESFARNLSATTGHKVVEGKDQMLLEQGVVVVCAGGKDTMFQTVGEGKLKLKVIEPLKQYNIHPSVNCLFKSAIEHSKKVAAIVLTGMGEDGLEGALEFNKFGLPVVAQDQESCLVYGMPRAIAENGLATSVLGINGIANKINQWSSNPGANAVKTLTN
jgi:two-component system, chemotaxis family, protein-glutamate methylesterase/glutaminase